MQLEQALTAVKAAGITKPKAKKAATKPTFNALGLPMNPNFDPNYRMKYRTPPLKRAQHVGTGVTPEGWAEMCRLAQAALGRPKGGSMIPAFIIDQLRRERERLERAFEDCRIPLYILVPIRERPPSAENNCLTHLDP